MKAHRFARVALAAGVAIVLGGCAYRAAPPSAGSDRGFVPDLVGAQVMVLPVQITRGVTGDGEAELVYALNVRGRGVRWLMPQTLRSQLARNPGLDVPLDDLPVGVFLQAQVNRVGDPLYSYLRRLSAVSNGTIALIPVEVRHRAATAELPGAVEVVAALVDVRSGRVPWFGVVQGAPGDGNSPGALASAADALARLLFPAGE